MKKLLLCSVFGPFGVQDDYGRRLNVMELFHNQVTREQGIYSLRMNHPTFGLYLIAENLKVPTVVLDFPTLDQFEREIRKGYEVIGISSIVANVGKVKKMVELIRQYSPNTEIVLGGHCTGISEIKKITGVDHISGGEGVGWFRQFFGEDITAPIKHPAMMSTLNRHIMGIPVPGSAAVLIPGLGCVNACSFCATSHHFGKRYVGYMNTGKEVFDKLQEIEEKLGCDEFFVMDENFLKHRIRAEELLSEMEKHNKYYYLGVFSSAETINSVGVEFMAKLGIDFVWMGVESKRSMFTKTQGVDLHATVKQLRSFGIHVLASGILFMDHHTPNNMQEDIDFITSLQTDFVQFMNLGPLPGTALYDELQEQERILHDVPFLEWHGQDGIWFKHDHYTPEETGAIIKRAFEFEYEQQGPSLMRLADTTLRGYRTVKHHEDARIRGLAPRLKKRCDTLRPLFPAAMRFAENEKTRQLVRELQTEYDKEFGAGGPLLGLVSAVANGFAHFENKRLQAGFDMRQPPVVRKKYRMHAAVARVSNGLDTYTKALDTTDPMRRSPSTQK